jgi:hypothetical protein
VHYEALTIEQGAKVDGKFAPDAGKPAVLELGSDEQPLSLVS